MNPLRRRSPIQQLLLCSTLLAGLLTSGRAEAGPPPLRYVLIPKLSHPWFEGVRRGALEAATMIQQQSRRTAVIDYRPPASADVAQQAAILEAAIRSRPNGISIDLLDADQLKPWLLYTSDAADHLKRVHTDGLPLSPPKTPPSTHAAQYTNTSTHDHA